MDQNIIPQERNILIVPIGLEIDRVIKGCKMYPINIIYLLHNPLSKSTKYAVEEYSNRFTKKVKNILNKSFNLISEEIVNLGSFESCLEGLNRILEKEQITARLQHIYINISTASKIFAIASYIFASREPKLFTLFYLQANEYILLEHLRNKNSNLEQLEKNFMEVGLTTGEFLIKEVPILKTQWFEEKERRILAAFTDGRSYNSLLEIIDALKEDNNPKNRMRIRRTLNKFEDLGLIEIKKRGKQLMIAPIKNYNSISQMLDIIK